MEIWVYVSCFLLLWWFWRTGQLAEHHLIDDCGSLCQTLRAKYELWIISCLPNSSTHLKTIVSFTNVYSTQKKEAEELAVSCFFVGGILSVGNFQHCFLLEIQIVNYLQNRVPLFAK